jgi:DNA-binding XRE family transcriptional regulator
LLVGGSDIFEIYPTPYNGGRAVTVKTRRFPIIVNPKIGLTVQSGFTALPIGPERRLKTLRTRGHRVLTDLLIDVRQKKGLTQDQLAERLKRNQQYVDRIESGQQIPDPLECRAWAAACGVTGWAFWWRLETRLKRHP